MRRRYPRTQSEFHSNSKSYFQSMYADVRRTAQFRLHIEDGSDLNERGQWDPFSSCVLDEWHRELEISLTKDAHCTHTHTQMMGICIFRCRIIDNCVNVRVPLNVSKLWVRRVILQQIVFVHFFRGLSGRVSRVSVRVLIAFIYSQRPMAIHSDQQTNRQTIIIIANGISFVQTAKLKHSIRKTILPMSWQAHSNIARSILWVRWTAFGVCVCVWVCCSRGREQRNARLCNVIRSAAAAAKNIHMEIVCCAMCVKRGIQPNQLRRNCIYSWCAVAANRRRCSMKITSFTKYLWHARQLVPLTMRQCRPQHTIRIRAYSR